MSANVGPIFNAKLVMWHGGTLMLALRQEAKFSNHRLFGKMLEKNIDHRPLFDLETFIFQLISKHHRLENTP